VISAVAFAEFGAHALAYWPSSPLLWYLNLEVFRPVQHSVVVEQGLVSGDFALPRARLQRLVMLRGGWRPSFAKLPELVLR